MVKRGMFSLILISILFICATPHSKADLAVNDLFGNAQEVDAIVILKNGHSLETGKEEIFKNLRLKNKDKKLLAAETQEYDFDLKNSYASLNAFSGKIKKSSYQKLSSNPQVERILKDNVRSFALDSSALQVNATNAWRLIYNGTNITGKGESICVVDSGIDYTHESLGGCTSTQFLSGKCGKVIAGYDFKNSDDNPIDDHGHGTHVSGIIASTSKTYRGVAPDASLVAMKVCDNSPGGNCFDSDIIAAIDWCISNASKYNISVISMSLGGGLFTSYCDDESTEAGLKAAIDSAVANNISVVVASGNGGSTTQISSPACLKNSTAVGSVTKQNAISVFSNRNSAIDLFAPGSSIKSTVPKAGCILCDSSGYLSLSGTSMATPHVSGAFALLHQYRKLEQNQILTPEEIVNSLSKTGKEIDDSFGSGLTFSRINVYSALLSLDKIAPEITIVSPTPINNSQLSNTYFIVNITSNEILSGAVLEFNSTNETINATNIPLNWMVNKTSAIGVFNYRIYANDSAGNMMITPTFRISINNSAPNISSFNPEELNVSINEPDNLTFNITAHDVNGDEITIEWRQNGSLKSTTNNFLFSGNFSAAGFYNITVEVSDGILLSSLTWNLTVRNTNIVPNITSVTTANSDYLNRTNGTLQAFWTFYDFDNDNIILNETLWYVNKELVNNYTNKTAIHQLNTTRLENWTSSVRIFDGTNWSNFVDSSAVKIENAKPSVGIGNSIMIIQETQLVNISVNATDLDSDPLTITSNKSEFSLSGNNLLWYTNLSSNGFYELNITASDGFDSDSTIVTVIVFDARDSDNDGNPDFNESDDDGDGIIDDNDFLIGGLSSINTTISLNVTINGTSNLTSFFNGTFLVEITNGSDSIIEFNFTFNSSNVLDLSNLTINSTKNGSSAISIKGDLNLFNATKTFFLEKRNSSVKSVCVKDASSGIDSISSACDSDNETLVICNNSSNGKYACFDTRTRYRVTGLRHSAVKELCRDNDGDGYGAVAGCATAGDDCNDNDASKTTDCSSPSNGGSSGGGGGGGGGSGGGGGFAYVCNQEWKCGEWSSCINGLQARECDFVKVAQHAQESECPSADNKPVTSKTCETPTLALEAASCSDNIKNQDEEGTDCGGICPPCGNLGNSGTSPAIVNETTKNVEQPTGFAVKDIVGKEIPIPFIWTLATLIITVGGIASYRSRMNKRSKSKPITKFK